MVLVLVEAVAVVVVVLVEALIYYHNYHNHNHEYYHCHCYCIYCYIRYICYYIHPIRCVQLATYCKNYDGNNIQQYANNTTTIYFLPVSSEEGRAIFPRRRLQYTVLLLVSKLQIRVAFGEIFTNKCLESDCSFACGHDESLNETSIQSV